MTSKGKAIVSKGSRQNVKCERTELLMILRCYQIHPGDNNTIVDEIIENKSELSTRAPKNKLKSRVRDQIFLMLARKKNIQDDEISMEVTAVCEMQQLISNKTLNSTGEKSRKKLSEPQITRCSLMFVINGPREQPEVKNPKAVTLISTDEDEPERSSIPKPSTSRGTTKIDPTKRKEKEMEDKD